jgi:hypothetical protein
MNILAGQKSSNQCRILITTAKEVQSCLVLNITFVQTLKPQSKKASQKEEEFPVGWCK